MTRIILKPLKSKKQLRKIAFNGVVSAGFTDDREKCFAITFNTESGTKIDLTVIFETRTPRTYISEEYKD